MPTGDVRLAVMFAMWRLQLHRYHHHHHCCHACSSSSRRYYHTGQLSTVHHWCTSLR